MKFGCTVNQTVHSCNLHRKSCQWFELNHMNGVSVCMCVSVLRTGHSCNSEVRQAGGLWLKQTSMCGSVLFVIMHDSRKLLTWHYQTNKGQEIKFGCL